MAAGGGTPAASYPAWKLELEELEATELPELDVAELSALPELDVAEPSALPELDVAEPSALPEVPGLVERDPRDAEAEPPLRDACPSAPASVDPPFDEDAPLQATRTTSGTSDQPARMRTSVSRTRASAPPAPRA